MSWQPSADHGELDGLSDDDHTQYALKSNVLELDNTDSFTPDADYEPATKKYVDDNAGGGGSIGGSTGSTDNALLRADGTGGSTVQGSLALLDDDGKLTLARILIDPSGTDDAILTWTVPQGVGSSPWTIGIDQDDAARFKLCYGTSFSGVGYVAQYLAVTIFGDYEVGDGSDVVLGTTTGTKIGTATNEKLSFWNASPIIQPTTAVSEAAFTENSGGTAVNDDSTFDGYTLRQVVKALRNVGILA